MSYIPNIKYKSEMCNYWKEGNFGFIKANSVKRDTVAFSLMENRNYKLSSRYFFFDSHSKRIFFFAETNILEPPGHDWTKHILPAAFTQSAQL